MTASKVFQKVFTHKNLKKVFLEHISGSSAIGMDRVKASSYESYLDEELKGIVNRIKKSTYKFTPYKQKLISKGPNKSPRVISIPTVRDRLTIRALCDFFNQLYSNLNLEIPQVKIESVKKALASPEYDSFIKIDLSSFYTSIPQNLLDKKLKQKIKKKEILKLITSAIQAPTTPSGKKAGSRINKDGVPQGLAISNVLAEIYISDFDKEMNKLPAYYARYVDDILILCNHSQIDSLTKAAYEKLEALKLKPHKMNENSSKSTSGKLSKEFDYLGYLVKDKSLSVKLSTIQKFEAGIASVFTAYKYQLSKAKNQAEKQRAINICEWRLNLKISGCIFEGRRLGWMFYFSQVDTTTPLRSLDSTIESLVKRFHLNKKIRVKKLVKTFYETKRASKYHHRYIPNFDVLTPSEMREILASFLVNKSLTGYSDSQIINFFKMRVGSVVKELEKDLAATS